MTMDQTTPDQAALAAALLKEKTEIFESRKLRLSEKAMRHIYLGSVFMPHPPTNQTSQEPSHG